MNENVTKIANKLSGMEYGMCISPQIINEAEINNIVIVYGSSEDVVEFNGAIKDVIFADSVDEAGIDDAIIYINGTESIDESLYDKSLYNEITACWHKNGFIWSFKTDIPHEKFIIYEDSEPFCEGIVFCLNDLEKYDENER